MKFLVVLAALAALTGCDGRFVETQQPRSQVDMVKDVFWDYVAKTTNTAELSLEQIQQSELGQEVNTLISESTEVINKFADAMRAQVAPLTQDLMTKVTQEAERLKARLQEDLTAVSTNMQPYTEEMMEELRNHAASYAEAMDSESVKAVVVQKSQELRERLDWSVEQLQAQMVPVTEEMKQKVEQSLEEFKTNVMPVAQNFQTQLTKKTEEIQQSLTPLGEQLKVMLDKDTQQLKKQLVALWRSFTRVQ